MKIRKLLLAITLLLTPLMLVACNKQSKEVSVTKLTITRNKDDEKDINDDKYYFDRNESIYYNIFLENEKEYEILSIKINDTLYTKENFAENSTSTLIVIEEYSGNDTGKHNLEVTEVIFNKNNKSVKGTHNKASSVELNIRARFVPVASTTLAIADYQSIKLNISIRDRDGLVNYDKGDAIFTMFDGDKQVHQQTLKIDDNIIEINDLKIAHKYTYRVDVKYDEFTEEGIIEKTLLEEEIQTNNPFVINVIDELEEEIELNIDKLYDDVEFKSLEVYKGSELIQTHTTKVDLISNLESGVEYNLVINFTYVLNGETLTQSQSKLVKTFKLEYYSIIRDGREVIDPGSGKIVKVPTYKRQNEEVRAIWFSTVSNIDIPTINHFGTVERYKEYIISSFDSIKEAKFNTIFFQIRPMNDAFYPSELAPWSRYVGGRGEGYDPGFDLLRFVIDEAHKRELELHGWLNPYRVASNPGILESAAPNNFAKLNPDLVLTDKNGASILDPGQEKVQVYIRDVIKEIVNNYPDINGIHFDDYFYLSSFGEKSDAPDYQTYLNNRESSSQTIADFRRASVTKVIKGIYEDVEAFNQKNNVHIRFGVSPSGIWANKKDTQPDGSNTRGMEHYSALYADTRLWIKKGYIHYIIPQIYWDFRLSAAPFATLVDWWADVVQGTDVDLIIGQGLYRYRDTPWVPREIPEQLQYIQTRPEIAGVSFFTYKDIVASTPSRLVEAMNMIKNEYWTKEAKLPWETNIYK